MFPPCRSAELALSEANLCDPEHPGVWGQLALQAVRAGREGDAGQALKQAQRCGLACPDLLTELADAYTERGRFERAADCLARAAGVRDNVKVGFGFEECLMALSGASKLVLMHCMTTRKLQRACCVGVADKWL